MYSPYAQRSDDVKGNNQLYEGASIIGVSSTLPDMRDIPVEDGRFFTENEERLRRPVAVIGEDIRDALFQRHSPIGRTIRVGGHGIHRHRPARKAGLVIRAQPR